MNLLIEILSYFVVALIGVYFGLTLNNNWSDWKDIGVIYNSAEYHWRLLQVRVKTDGTKKFRHIKVMNYGNLPIDIQNKINNVQL